MRYCPTLWCCRRHKPPRPMIAFNLDETLFVAQRAYHSSFEHLKCRHFPNEFLTQAKAPDTLQISNEDFTFHFLNVSSWHQLYSRLLDNGIPIVLITNGH